MESAGRKPKFNDAETLFAAIQRVGKSTLEDFPNQLDRVEFSRPLQEQELKTSLEIARRRTLGFIVQGRLKQTVDLLSHNFERPFDALISELYRHLIAEHFPPEQVEADPRERELLSSMEAMKEELFSITRKGRFPTPGVVRGALTGKPYNVKSYKTRKAGSTSTSATWIMDIEEVKWAISNFEAVISRDLTFGSATDGLRITHVRTGSQPAARGFKAGDIVQSINNKRIKSVEDIRALRDDPAFDAPRLINVKIIRNGKTRFLRYSIPRPPPRR